MHVQSVRLNTV